MKYKGIELDGLDIEIDIEAAKSFIEHREINKARLTQRAFDQAMVKSLDAFKVGMTPSELIDFTVEAGWKGINLNYTRAKLSREMTAAHEARSTLSIGRSEAPKTTREMTLQDEADDSWAH